MPNVFLVLQRAFDRARPYLVAASLFVGVSILLVATNQHERVANWIFWKYAALWLWTLVFTCSSLFAGHALLSHLPGLNLRLRERLLFDFAVGVFVFGTGIFLCGVSCPTCGGPFGTPAMFPDARSPSRPCASAPAYSARWGSR
jgi:hypothetical protein